MSYQIKYSNTLKPGAPEYDEWIRELDLSDLDKLSYDQVKIRMYQHTLAEFKRIVGSKTPQEVIDDITERKLNSSTGHMLSLRLRPYQKDAELIETWETEDAQKRAENGVKISPATGFLNFKLEDPEHITGNGTQFTTEVSVHDDIFITIRGYTTVCGTVLDVISDTELRLHRNRVAENCCVDPVTCHLYTVPDWEFSVYDNQIYINFLRQVYDALYIEHSSISTTS